MEQINNFKRDDFRQSRFLVDLKLKLAKSAPEKPNRRNRIEGYLADFFDRPSAPRSRAKFRIDLGRLAAPLSVLGGISYRLIAGLGEAAFKGVRHFRLFRLSSLTRLFSTPRQTTPPNTPHHSAPPLSRGERRGGENLLEYALERLAAKEVAAVKRTGLLRQALIFAVIMMALILPLKTYTYYRSLDRVRGQVLAAGTRGLDDIVAAGKAAVGLDLRAAQGRFTTAGENFIQAEESLKEVNGLILALAALAPDGEIRLAADSEKIVKAGQAASSLGENLSKAVASLLPTTGSSTTPAQTLSEFLKYGRLAATDAGTLSGLITGINGDNLPTEHRDKFELLKIRADFLKNSLAEFIELAEKLNVFLAAGDFRRYLLVFQNNAEARATGGFLGSFALLDISNGRIKKLEAPGGGTYDTEAGLKLRVIAPRPLWLVNPLWHLWDANWWPDWPTSARKIAWFYEKSDGPTVDGVISLTPDVLGKILTITGPIDMTEKYGVNVTAENYLDTLQQFAEQKPDVTREPKKIIGDLLDRLLTDLSGKLDRERLFKLIDAIEASLNERQILLYFKDVELENAVSKYGWDGRLKNTGRDYLTLVNTNIAGGKSDRKVIESVSHLATISLGGEVTDTVTIRREHTGSKGDGLYGVRNVNWLRVYVPEGSELLEASGFVPPQAAYFGSPDPAWSRDRDLETEENARIDSKTGTRVYVEAGKTVFANWSMIDPGDTAVITLRYKLPFRVGEPAADDFWSKLLGLATDKKKLAAYSLYIQKQAGSKPGMISSAIELPPSLKPVWRYPENTAARDGYAWVASETASTDRYWATVLENN